MRKLRIVSRDGQTRITDASTGDEIEHVTSVEVFQVGLHNPVFSVVKVVGTVDEIDLLAHADVVEDVKRGGSAMTEETKTGFFSGWRVRWASKTLWFNLISAVLAGLEMSFHFVKPLLSDAAWGGGMFAVAMVNVVLRALSTKPLIERVETATVDQSDGDAA